LNKSSDNTGKAQLLWLQFSLTCPDVGKIERIWPESHKTPCYSQRTNKCWCVSHLPCNHSSYNNSKLSYPM
jgi:hypothetical protein